MKKSYRSLIVNLGLLLPGLLTIFSGLLIQIQYHIGNHGSNTRNDLVAGINYDGWSTLHKITVVVLSILMIFHIYMHWKWYKVTLKKRLLVKNGRVLILSAIFFGCNYRIYSLVYSFK